MEGWAFLGGFAAIAAGLLILGLIARKKLREWSIRIFGTAHILSALSQAGQEVREPGPRSVSGYDQFLLPKILRDFPDFDVTTAKIAAKNYLKQQLSEKKNLRIHKIVLTEYLPSASQKTIVFQAAAGYRQEGRTFQGRYNLYYTYEIRTGDTAVAANCPNCGSPLPFGAVSCEYCGSRVVNVMGSTWKFTDIRET